MAGRTRTIAAVKLWIPILLSICITLLPILTLGAVADTPSTSDLVQEASAIPGKSSYIAFHLFKADKKVIADVGQIGGTIEVKASDDGALQPVSTSSVIANPLDKSELLLQIFGHFVGKNTLSVTFKPSGASPIIVPLATVTVTVQPNTIGIVDVTGAAIPLSDNQVSRLYGSEVSKAYNVVQVTFSNRSTAPSTLTGGTVPANHIIVMPQQISFDVIIRTKDHLQDEWSYPNSSRSDLSTLVPNGSMQARTQLAPASINNPSALRTILRNVTRTEPNKPLLAYMKAQGLLEPGKIPTGDSGMMAKYFSDVVRGIVRRKDQYTDALWANFSNPPVAEDDRIAFLLQELSFETDDAIAVSIPVYTWYPLSADAMHADFDIIATREREPRGTAYAKLILSLATAFGNSTLLKHDSVANYTADVGLLGNVVLPAFQSAFPDMSATHKSNLVSFIFSAPLDVAPGATSPAKHLFVSKELLRSAFGAKYAEIVGVAKDTIHATVAVVQSQANQPIRSDVNSGG